MTALYQTQDAISYCNEVAPLSTNTSKMLIQNVIDIYNGAIDVGMIETLYRHLFLTNSGNLDWVDCMKSALGTLGI